MSSGIDEMGAEVDARGNVEGKAGLQDFRYALQNFRNPCEIFATIAKISQSLQKFRYAQFFAKLAKVTVHSENLNFRYASHFRYDSEIHYA